MTRKQNGQVLYRDEQYEYILPEGTTPPLSLKEIAACCHLTVATVRKHLKVSEQEGWIESLRLGPGVYMFRLRLPDKKEEAP